ncbi:hypothetical protein QYF36_025786 [Acer negundo]|nr:hypothetical protein QYF36_025786 [Acer negundo]
MDDGERSFLAVKLSLVLVPVIITVISDSKLVAACDEVFEADALVTNWEQTYRSVPDALIQKSKDGTLLLRPEENQYLKIGLCLSVSCHEQKKFIVPILASTIGALLILFTFIVLALFIRKRKRGMVTGSKKERSLKSKNKPYTYSEIVSIIDAAAVEASDYMEGWVTTPK